jgi:hypothetical protein
VPIHQVATITKSEKENDIVTTLTFDLDLENAGPGQFVMLWLPGSDEKPYGIAGISPLRISVGARGEFSSTLCSMKKGDRVWLRGPYGKGFALKGKKALLVGGGYGFGPLRFLAEEAKKKKGIKTKQAWRDGRCKPWIINHGKFRFTSKGEEEIRNYFIDNFPEDEWTFGGGIKVEDKRISRDLYSNKLKVCIEYDGIWHFKDIKGQLKKKQYKDSLLEKWCIENSYKLIRIKEEVYLKDKINLLNLVVSEVYEKNNMIVKFY